MLFGFRCILSVKKGVKNYFLCLILVQCFLELVSENWNFYFIANFKFNFMKLSEEQCNIKSPVTWTEFRATLPFSRNGNKGGFHIYCVKETQWMSLYTIKLSKQIKVAVCRNRSHPLVSTLACFVFCICKLKNKYHKNKSVELGDQLVIIMRTVKCSFKRGLFEIKLQF